MPEGAVEDSVPAGRMRHTNLLNLEESRCNIFHRFEENRRAGDLAPSGPEDYLNLDEAANRERAILNQKNREMLRKRHRSMSTPASTTQPSEEFIKVGIVDDKEEKSAEVPSNSEALPNVPWRDFLGGGAQPEKVEDLMMNLDFFGRLHEEICALLLWLEPSTVEQDVRLKIFARICVLARSMWKECDVAPFGSFYTGLHLPHGDLDVCIMKVPGNSKLNLKLLSLHLHKWKMAQAMEVITAARVPIVKFVDAESGIPVDISINQESSRDTSEFVRENVAKYPWMRPMILLMKLYLQQRGLGETYKGGVGSYLLFVLLLSFFQHHRISYSIVAAKRTNLGHMLYDFLQLYGIDFGYETTGISVQASGSYFPKIRRRMYYDERPNLIAVESPLDPASDLGKNSYNLFVVAASFRQSFFTLTELHKKWKEGRLPPSESILSSLIFPSDPLFAHRKRTVDVNPMPLGRLRDVPVVPDSILRKVKSEIRRAFMPSERKKRRRDSGPGRLDETPSPSEPPKKQRRSNPADTQKAPLFDVDLDGVEVWDEPNQI